MGGIFSGRNDYEASLELIRSLQAPSGMDSWLQHPRLCIQPFLEQMPLVLAATDAAVCRAGSMTLAELAVAGIPALLVPYPYAAANHQAYNAVAVSQAGAAEVVADGALTSAVLCRYVQETFSVDEQRKAMGLAAKALGHPEATQAIVRQLLNWLS
ncbi:MAG: UDP-N-acetylglucosamine--N-acetylmuramyl-(pentapeptide) pyrophosphoryl-undecaprenol N-acetylglucosamine transferase [Vampirovibrionales bacterium]